MTHFTATYDALGRQTWIHEQGVIGRVVAGCDAWGSDCVPSARSPAPHLPRLAH